jgi:hypothetical protein
MPEPDVELAPAPAESGAAKAPRKKRRAGRKQAALRKERIFERLIKGGSYLAIAREENCSIQWVRRIVAEALRSRAVDPPAEFAQLQIARLNQALNVAHSYMINGELAAMDRYLKTIKHLDRYHGLQDAAPPLALAAPAPRALPAPDAAPETSGAQDGYETIRN